MNKPHKFKRTLYALAFALCLGIGGYKLATQEPMVWRFALDDFSQVDLTAPAKFSRVFNYSINKVAHSAAILVHPKNDKREFRLMWFQGSQEAGRDVAIFYSDLHKSATGWQSSKPKPFIYPKALGQALKPRQAVSTLGNTVQFGDKPNQYLTTLISVGGWAMASVAWLKLADDDTSINQARILPLSPILNRSYLVRSPTIAWQNGDIGLPAYFEMGTFYGVLVRMGAEGKVKDQRTISRGALGIQPTVVVLDEQKAVAFLRNFSEAPADRKSRRRLVASWTTDAGQSWSSPERLELPNPDSPVAALRLSDGRILMGFNDHHKCADIFRLAVSSDAGRSWQRIATLEDHKCESDKSARYPMLRRLNNGDMALTYSFDSKGGIRAYVFNESWVNEQLEKTRAAKP